MDHLTTSALAEQHRAELLAEATRLKPAGRHGRLGRRATLRWRARRR